MSELEIVRGGVTLEAKGNGAELKVQIWPAWNDTLSAIPLSRLEVLQLRDWLNRWLEETPL